MFGFKKVVSFQSALALSLLACVACAPNPQTPGQQIKATDPTQALDARGTDSSGGGDTIIRSSTDEQVLTAIEQVKARLPMEFDKSVYEDLPKIKSRRLQNVLMGMVSGGQPGTYGMQDTEVSALIKNVKFHIEENGPCRHDGEDSDASTVFKKGAEICFSLPRLKQIPPEALYPQIMALTAHEMTHQFGFGEEEAQEVQNYFLKEILTDNVFIRKMIDRSAATAFTEVESIRNSDDTNSLCSDVQKTTTVIAQFRETIVALQREASSLSPQTYYAIAQMRIDPIVDDVKKLSESACAPEGAPDNIDKKSYLEKTSMSLSQLGRSLSAELIPRQL